MQLLSQNILEKRLAILLNKVRGLSDTACQAQVGTEQELLMETPRKGRTSGNFWAQTKNDFPIGSIVKTKIEKAKGTLLITRD